MTAARFRVLSAGLVLAALAHGPRASAAPQEAKPAAKPTAAAPRVFDPRTQALINWIDGIFTWGPGETVVDEVAAVRVPGWRLFRAEKKFKADEHLNDATFLAVDDKALVAIVGDAFLDEARVKLHQPLKGEADLAGLKAQLARFFRGSFRVVLDPAHDRLPTWKAVSVKLDTGYGEYEVGGFVKADDGAFLLLGRAWDRRRPIADQRREMVNVKDAPSDGPDNARVTVVEFSDMECGFCKRRTADWEPLLAKLAGQLTVKRYFKFFPLTEHPWAFRAASAGFCLSQLSGSDLFLAFKKQVYAQQESLSVPGMDLFALDFARANEVSEGSFKSCYLQDRSTRRVHADLTEGFALRVRATPTYIIDGIAVSWYGDDLMEEFLRKTYLKGAGLPLPTRPPAAKPAGAK